MGRKKKLPEGIVLRPGRPGYYADFLAGGERVQRKLSDDLDTARRILHALRARADQADFGLLDNDYPLADLHKAYIGRCKQELGTETVARYEISLDQVLDWLKVAKVCHLTVPRVIGYREHRLGEGVCARTVNHDVGVLKSMLNWGVDPAKLIGSNPLTGLKPLPHEPKDGRPLSDEEVRRLIERSRPHWRDIWYALLVTGLRSDELAELRFTDVDWEARELAIVGKGKKPRRVPIDNGLYAILERQRDEAPDRRPGKGRTAKVTALVRARLTREHVFTTTQNTPLAHRSCLYGAFMRSCELAEIETRTEDAEGNLIEHVNVHSLRRTFTTNAIVNGADPKSVQEVLGHSTLEMTMKVYAKVKAGPKRAAIGKLSYGSGATAPDHLIPINQEKTTNEPGKSSAV